MTTPAHHHPAITPINRAERRAAARIRAKVNNSPEWRRKSAIEAHRRAAAAHAAQAKESARLDATSMDDNQRRDLMAFAYASLAAVPAGDATDVDLSNLAVITNISHLLCDRGYGADAEPEIIAAQDAVVSMQARYQRTGRVGASGPELQALRMAIDIHEQQMEAQPTCGEMRELLAEMRAANEQLMAKGTQA